MQSRAAILSLESTLRYRHEYFANHEQARTMHRRHIAYLNRTRPLYAWNDLEHFKPIPLSSPRKHCELLTNGRRDMAIPPINANLIGGYTRLLLYEQPLEKCNIFVINLWLEHERHPIDDHDSVIDAAFWRTTGPKAIICEPHLNLFYITQPDS